MAPNPQGALTRPAPGFLRLWAGVTAAGALLTSCADAALIQRRDSYFTGGFLSDAHLRSATEIVSFVVVSLLADAAVIGLMAGLVIWACCRARWSWRACALAGLLAGIGPIAAADVVSYQLVRYVGDAVDLSLAFDLTGRSIAEFVAVAWSHLLFPAVAMLFAVAAGLAVVWCVERFVAGTRTVPVRARALVLPILCAIFGLGVTTMGRASNDRLENGMFRKPSGKVLALVADEASDLDRDGFGIAGRLSDPDPLNASVFPYAIDLPGNGVDENGVGGDLPVQVSQYAEGPAQARRWVSTPDVLLIVLESFRADLVGAAFRGKPITPTLNALAARGVMSGSAYSPNGYTAQSRFHILSGSLAGLRASTTLIDDFRANGYFTAYFSAQDESFGGARYDVGFDRAQVHYDARVDRDVRYSTFTTAGSLAVPFPVVQLRLSEFLRTAVWPTPLFLYVNFHDTHFPYTHDEVRPLLFDAPLSRGDIGPAKRDALWATYVNTAANVDRAIGNVIAAVRTARGRDPAIIVTADHGESLYDSDFLGHGQGLDEVQTRVPLVVADLPMVIEEPFSHVDLRDAIGRALSETPNAPPIVRRQPGRQVFQYLGHIDRPRQIAFFRDGARVIYDFRSRRLQVNGGAWQRPESASAADRDEFQQLVWHWERLNFARQRVRGDRRAP